MGIDDKRVVISNSFYGIAVIDFSSLSTPIVEQLYIEMLTCGF